MSDYEWLVGWIMRRARGEVLQITPRKTLSATFFCAEIVVLRVETSLIDDPRTRIILVAEAESSNALDALAHLREKIERGETLDSPKRLPPRKAMDWDEFPEVFR